MDKQISEMIVIPEGSPYGVHITYHYDVNTQSSSSSRAVFTEEQVLILEREFESTKYLTLQRRAELANCLGMREKQVKDWFQNRRTKAKKEGEVFKRAKKHEEQQNEDGICNILAFLQDQGTSINARENNEQCSMDEIEAALEVLQKHAQNHKIDQTSTSKKRRREIEIEILDHQVYDPITGMWNRTA